MVTKTIGLFVLIILLISCITEPEEKIITKEKIVKETVHDTIYFPVTIYEPIDVPSYPIKEDELFGVWRATSDTFFTQNLISGDTSYYFYEITLNIDIPDTTSTLTRNDFGQFYTSITKRFFLEGRKNDESADGEIKRFNEGVATIEISGYKNASWVISRNENKLRIEQIGEQIWGHASIIDFVGNPLSIVNADTVIIKDTVYATKDTLRLVDTVTKYDTIIVNDTLIQLVSLFDSTKLFGIWDGQYDNKPVSLAFSSNALYYSEFTYSIGETSDNGYIKTYENGQAIVEFGLLRKSTWMMSMNNKELEIQEIGDKLFPNESIIKLTKR